MLENGGIMTIVLLLGKDRKYLAYKEFNDSMEADMFIESIEDLMYANACNDFSLRERLEQHCPEYFTYAGAVQDYEIIEVGE